MRKLLNIEEVFSMAVQIESNAIDFYRKAAGLQTDTSAAAFLEDLAAMEQEHRSIFAGMHTKIRSVPEPVEGLDPEGGLYMSAIAAGYRVEGSPVVTGTFTGDESLADILTTGIELEKQSILFYVGLKDLFPMNDRRALINKIIEEEKGHIAALAKKLAEL